MIRKWLSSCFYNSVRDGALCSIRCGFSATKLTFRKAHSKPRLISSQSFLVPLQLQFFLGCYGKPWHEVAVFVGVQASDTETRFCGCICVPHFSLQVRKLPDDGLANHVQK